MTLENYKGNGWKLTHNVDDQPEEEQFHLHVHEDYELYCMVAGKVGYVVEGRVYDLRPGSLMLMRSAESHRLLVNKHERYERYVLNFRPELIEEQGGAGELLRAFTERGLGERNLYLPSEFSGIEPLGMFRQMCAGCTSLSRETTVRAFLTALLCAVNTVFLQHAEEPMYGESDIGRELITYINENLLEELSLSTISAKIHLSPSQINRVFRGLTGTSVYQYILSKRLIVAQGMIAQGESAMSASQKCGFRDYSAFYRLYKKRMGSAPTAKKRT
ncbi:MAG: helix-turn-helix transcriptional regulator [Clostridia bacterium]|nr:helix-turn-helix transcriptional regulator [Clostridia bacterium]